MSCHYISTSTEIFSLHRVTRHPFYDESSPKLHSVKPVVKLISPFYLNREGGMTRLLNVLGAILQLIIVIFKFDLTRQCNRRGEPKTHMIRGFEPKDFSGTMIESSQDERNLFFCDSCEGSILRKIQADQIIDGPLPISCRVRCSSAQPIKKP